MASRANDAAIAESKRRADIQAATRIAWQNQMTNYLNFGYSAQDMISIDLGEIMHVVEIQDSSAETMSTFALAYKGYANCVTSCNKKLADTLRNNANKLAGIPEADSLITAIGNKNFPVCQRLIGELIVKLSNKHGFCPLRLDTGSNDGRFCNVLAKFVPKGESLQPSHSKWIEVQGSYQKDAKKREENKHYGSWVLTNAHFFRNTMSSDSCKIKVFPYRNSLSSMDAEILEVMLREITVWQ